MARRIIPSGHFHLARLLLLVDYLVICFDDVVLLRPRLGASCCSGWLPCFGCRSSLRLLLVERLSRLAEDLRQLFLSGAAGGPKEGEVVDAEFEDLGEKK